MDIFIEEYVLFAEYMQGNVNVPGLVFDDLVDEEVIFDEECFFVFFDTIEDFLGVACDYSRIHLTYVDEKLYLATNMGNVPVEVYKNVLQVAYARAAAPAEVWWLGVNVLHGADAFFEEVYSNLHARVNYAQAVPYYWENVYESIGVEFGNIEPHPGIHLARYISTGDLINFRHEVLQQYFFNSQAYDRVGAFARLHFGYGKTVSSELLFRDHPSRILGAPVDEHFTLVDSHYSLSSLHLAESLFLGDVSAYIRHFMESVEDFYELDDTAIDKFWMLHSVFEDLELVPSAPGYVSRSMFLHDAVRVVAGLSVLQSCHELAYDSIEVDLDTGVVNLARDGADSDLGFADEVTSE